jgi:hypothetical protein
MFKGVSKKVFDGCAELLSYNFEGQGSSCSCLLSNKKVINEVNFMFKNIKLYEAFF